jgi:hypothetical protein
VGNLVDQPLYGAINDRVCCRNQIGTTVYSEGLFEICRRWERMMDNNKKWLQPVLVVIWLKLLSVLAQLYSWPLSRYICVVHATYSHTTLGLHYS